MLFQRYDLHEKTLKSYFWGGGGIRKPLQPPS